MLVRDSELGDADRRSGESCPSGSTGRRPTSSRLAKEIAESLDEAIAPLQRLQDEEMERRASDAREMGQRSVGESTRHRCAVQARAASLSHSTSCASVSPRSPTCIASDCGENLEASAEGDVESERRVGASLRAIDVVAEANGRLTTNVDETLAVARSDAVADGVLTRSRGVVGRRSGNVALCAWVAQSVEQRIRNA